jgi:hypothetical protein
MPWLNWACWVWDCSRAVAECKASERVFAWAYSGTIS